VNVPFVLIDWNRRGTNCINGVAGQKSSQSLHIPSAAIDNKLVNLNASIVGQHIHIGRIRKGTITRPPIVPKINQVFRAYLSFHSLFKNIFTLHDTPPVLGTVSVGVITDKVSNFDIFIF